jgi:hypothetical protein
MKDTLILEIPRVLGVVGPEKRRVPRPNIYFPISQ